MSIDDDCGDIYDVPSQPRRLVTLPPNATPQQRQAALVQLDDKELQLRMLYLQLLATASTVTEVTSPFSGSDISDEYTAIFRNNTNNPMRVQVFADLVTPGCGAHLSTMPDKSNAGKFDTLSLTANGRVEAVPVIVLPTYAVWARQFNTAFPMGGSDLLRVRVFDPAKLISYSNLYPKKGL